MLWGVRPGHTLRFSYNQAFQAPAPVEVFLDLNVAPPTDLSSLEGFCAAYGASCGLGLTPIRAVGNPHLKIERVQSVEFGYRGVVGGRTVVTFDAYFARNRDFITSVLPQLGTPFGRLNRDFGPWLGPASAESTPVFPASCPAADASAVHTVADCIRTVVPGLSNDADGSNIIPVVSFTNFGSVKTRGIELAATHYVSKQLRFSSAASWFDFTLGEKVPGLDELLLPNAPSWQWSVGATFATGRWDASVGARWVDAFRWATGVFIGDVQSYTSLDLDANLHVSKRWSVGASASNLLDDAHYEFFGAPILRRRALVQLTYGR